MALKPELIRRRKRIVLPRAPERPLGAKGKELGQPVRIPDEELKALLEQLVSLAERETLFTATMEFFPRLETALWQAGYLFTIMVNIENQIGPGATVTTYLPVPTGYSFIPLVFDYYSSLPWWLSVAFWADADLPAVPNGFWVRCPERYTVDWKSTLSRVHRFLRYTVTNNHGVNTANFCGIHLFDVVTDDTYKMIEDVYLKPVINYVRDKAEQITGRPFP